MFNFAYPELLLLLWSLPVLAFLMLRYWYWRKRSIARLGDPVAMNRTIAGFSGPRFWLKNSLVLAAIALLSLALANPQRGAKKQTITQESADVFIALDISKSMLAEDLPPSRLELAKSFVQKLIKALEGERIGLIFFAGDAFLQMPLSTDYGFLVQSIQSASPELITAQGTAIPTAIDLALKSYDDQPSGRALVILSDGESHDDDAVSKAETAFEEGVVLCSVGIGTTDGGPIPTGNSFSAYKEDEKGNIVRTQLNESLLRKVATAGGGVYYHIKQEEQAIQGLVRQIDGLEKRALEVRSFSEFESWYRWFLLPAVLFLLLELWIQSKKQNKAS
jgi:Ca-activated chloride channel family protein